MTVWRCAACDKRVYSEGQLSTVMLAQQTEGEDAEACPQSLAGHDFTEEAS